MMVIYFFDVLHFIQSGCHSSVQAQSTSADYATCREGGRRKRCKSKDPKLLWEAAAKIAQTTYDCGLNGVRQ